MEGEGERNLKALPYIVSWFDRAGEAVTDGEGGEENYNIDERKLSAIYQFARAICHCCLSQLHISKERITNEKEEVCRGLPTLREILSIQCGTSVS